MSSRTSARIELVSVTAVVVGNIARLIDRSGIGIASTRLDRLGPVSAEVATRCLWEHAAKGMIDWFILRRLHTVGDPWTRKAKSLAASFRLRRFDRPRRGGRKLFDKYSTTTWRATAERMVEQGYNVYRRRDRSGWVLWSHTVSSNQNKRNERING